MYRRISKPLQSPDQGWATPGTCAELGTRAWPRKRVNDKTAAEVSLYQHTALLFFIFRTVALPFSGRTQRELFCSFE